MNPRRVELFWQLMAGVTVTCLVLITVVLVRQEFFPAVPQDIEVPDLATKVQKPVAEPPVPVENWTRVANGGHRIGAEDALVTMVVFSDFECPFCARFATVTWPTMRARFGDSLAMVFRHWPLSEHALAYPAARAAECASAQGRFERFHDRVFAGQRELGVKSLQEFAREAGVRDLKAFAVCANVSGRLSAIDADIAEVRRIGGNGTPTIVINGLRIRPPYSAQALSVYVQAAIDRNRQETRSN